MTKEEVTTLDDVLRFDCERCGETLKKVWKHVKAIHFDKPASVQVICLHRSLVRTYTERPEFLFSLMNAVIGKFLVPELTPEEQYSIRMHDLRSKNNG